MPNASEMIAIARALDSRALLDLYDRTVLRDTPGWPPGKALEHLVLRAFELEGAEVQWPYEVPLPESGQVIEQIDGVVYVGPLVLMVETKDTRDPQNVEPIVKLKSQLDCRPPHVLGLVVSRGGFTVPAVALTRLISGGRILLWRGNDLRAAVADGQVVPRLRQKYRYLVERAMPDLAMLPVGPRPPSDLAPGDSRHGDVPPHTR